MRFPGYAALVMAALVSTSARAEGNLAANGIDLPELKIDTRALSFSETEYQLETGKYYRLAITSDGGEEVDFSAPDLWRNSWLNHVTVDDVAIDTAGLGDISFDDEATVELSFVPIRPGEYAFFVPGYEGRGLKGKFVVK